MIICAGPRQGLIRTIAQEFHQVTLTGPSRDTMEDSESGKGSKYAKICHAVSADLRQGTLDYQ